MAGEPTDLDKYIDTVSDLAPTETTTQTTEENVSDKQTTTPSAEELNAQQQQREQNQQNQQQAKPEKDAKKGQTETQNKNERKVVRDQNGYLVDDKGNIVDDNGTILAPAGKARRIYEHNTRLTRQLEENTTRLQQAELQLREINYLNGVPQRYGLSNDEVATALDWAGRMKRGDVIGVAKDLVALLAAQGHNISELLGKDVGDSVDMRAVKTLIEQQMAPLRQVAQREEVSAQQLAEARTRMEAFLRDNEFAEVHSTEIAKLAQANGLTPQQAYNRLYKFAIDNGLDFSEPLGPQLEERAAQMQSQGQQQQQQQRQKPLPSSASGTRPSNGVKMQAPEVDDPDEDWGTIIHRAMNQNTH